ncbi:MAG: S8 family serine peptidase, partial [Candidatus Limnocylindria bacterium]
MLVRFLPGAATAERAAALRLIGGTVEAEIRALGVTVVVIAGATDVLTDGPSALETIARHPAVEFAELDRRVGLMFEPNDEFYFEHPSYEDGQWAIRKALVDKAWDSARGSPTLTVAVLDTGVDPTHPDLEEALVAGNTFVSRPDEDCTPGTTTDDNSHGTHVAGIIGASADNEVGVAGVAFGVRVMAVKVLDCTGQGSLSDVASGLTWAVDNGARVVNLSLGSMSDSPTLRRAIDYATDRDVLVVSASGNCGTTGDKCLTLNQVEYPAGYEDVLAVGATDVDDKVAFFSTRNETVDVAAPGRRIVSTTPTYATFLSQRETDPVPLEYAAFSGTSQAAPLVAGLAALLWSAEPELSRAEVIERIRGTADDLGPEGRDDSYGDGRVNALRAVIASDDVYAVLYEAVSLPDAALPARPFTASLVATNRSSFAWRSEDPSAVALRWSWLDPDGAEVPGLAGTIGLPEDVGIDESVALSVPVTTPAQPATYTLVIDLVRDGIVAFSTRGADALAHEVRVGSGIGASYEAPAETAAFDAGSETTLVVSVRNTGTVTWAATGGNPVRLSYHWLQAGAVHTWEGLRGALPADVPPGAQVSLDLPVLPPLQPGPYTLRLDLVQEGVAWYSDLGAAPLDLEAGVRAGYVASYEVGTPAILLPGGRAEVPVTVTNSGTLTWTAAGEVPVRLAAHLADSAGGIVLWDGIRTVLEEDVAPSGLVATEVVVDAPATPGSYRVRVDAVREGVAWFSGLGVAAGEVDLLVVADYRAELPTGPLTVSVADPRVEVTVRNIGVATWTLAVASPLALSAHWYDD